MNASTFLEILKVAEKLKCTTRHSWTSSGRHESVAEHSWRIGLMALLMRDEFPNIDIDKVIRMCLIHDLGEAFTGDIPAFDKREEDREKEDVIFLQWIETFPAPYREEFTELLVEMNERKTGEAKLYKALDNLEAVIQHNEADISTWIPLEYDLQFTYGADKVEFSSYLKELKKEIDKRTTEKIVQNSEVNITN